MNYQEIDRIAKEFEDKLIEGNESDINNVESKDEKISEQKEVKTEISNLEERIQDEKQETEIPETPLTASVDEIVASYKKLIRMAKDVKKSNLNEESKKAYIAKIKQASEKLGISKAELNRNLTGDPASIMKKVQEINKITKLEDSSKKLIRELIMEIGESFPMSILNKPLGNCTASEIIKLGPMLASLISKYEKSKINE